MPIAIGWLEIQSGEPIMPINVGTADRIIRIVAGVALIAYAAVSHGAIQWIAVAGVILIITAIVRFCPAYWLLRIKTIGRSNPVHT